MTATEQLQRVKESLSITGNHLDKTLQVWLDDVKYYMADAGVKDSVIESEKAIGAISRGVSDLWNYGKLSEYFYQRVSQLTLEDGEDSNTASGVTIASAELNLDSNDVIKNGRISMTDGSTVPIELKYVPELSISMTPVTYENPMTTVTISPSLDEGHKYIYRIGNGYLPAYLDVVENPNIWKDWDGVSQIDTDGSSSLYILEVDDNYVTYRGGYVRINIL